MPIHSRIVLPAHPKLPHRLLRKRIGRPSMPSRATTKHRTPHRTATKPASDLNLSLRARFPTCPARHTAKALIVAGAINAGTVLCRRQPPEAQQPIARIIQTRRRRQQRKRLPPPSIHRKPLDLARRHRTRHRCGRRFLQRTLRGISLNHRHRGRYTRNSQPSHNLCNPANLDHNPTQDRWLKPLRLNRRRILTHRHPRGHELALSPSPCRNTQSDSHPPHPHHRIGHHRSGRIINIAVNRPIHRRLSPCARTRCRRNTQQQHHHQLQRLLQRSRTHQDATPREQHRFSKHRKLRIKRRRQEIATQHDPTAPAARTPDSSD
jgi:hypothetical protein